MSRTFVWRDDRVTSPEPAPSDELIVDIAAARKLIEACSDGPWRVDQVTGLDGYPVVVSGTRLVAACDTMLRSHDHAAFIAASRTLLPACLDEIERLTALLIEQGLLAKLSVQWNTPLAVCNRLDEIADSIAKVSR